MSTTVVEPTNVLTLSPSASGSDKQQRWDEQTGDSDSIDVVNYNQGVDVAVDLVAGAHADDVVDPELAARVRRKIDWHILPLLFAIYTGVYDCLLDEMDEFVTLMPHVIHGVQFKALISA